MNWKNLLAMVAIALVVSAGVAVGYQALLAPEAEPVEPLGITNFDDVVLSGDLTVDGTSTLTGAVNQASTLSTGDLTLSAGSIISQSFGSENFGLPSVITAPITYTTSGALFTIADGEIWIVHRAILNVTTNYDCSGNDCTLDLGDSGDLDGLLNCADTNLQAANEDYTGGPAGWMGLDGAAPTGVYLVGGPHVYAPSGADETIDIAIGGTTPSAGAGTIYLVYTRIQ